MIFHRQPVFRPDGVRTPLGHLIGPVNCGKALVEGCFTGTAPIVGIFAAGLMRAAFQFTLDVARRETCGGGVPIIEHSSSTRPSATRSPTARAPWRRCAP